ncbi:MAG: CPBP family intramembrane glutamic endopeptidase [Fidelibacterota bacterium]
MLGKSREIYQILLMICVAGILWFFTFAVDLFNFWLKISLSAGSLAIISTLISSPEKDQYRITVKNIVYGFLSAGVLYGIFYLGNYVSGILFDFSAHQVGDIYAKAEGTHSGIILFILLCITSPAEEIFWRGYLQRKLMARYSDLSGWIIGSIVYGLVHVWSMNFMLVGAAMVAGAYWGLLYLRYRSLSMLIISHAVWTVGVFVLFPIG